MTRRDKVLQRTRVGGGLAVALGVILYLAARPSGAWVTLALALTITIWSVVEVRRMGLFVNSTAAAATAIAAVVTSISFIAQLMDGAVPSAPVNLPEESDLVIFSGQRAYAMLIAKAVGAGVLCGVVLGAFASRSRPGDAPRPQPAIATHWLVLLIGIPMLLLVPIRVYAGPSALVSLIVLAKIGDIAGYYFGNLMGKSRPFPRISPGKTTAGCVASLIAGTAVGGAFVAFGGLEDARFGVISGLVLGAVVNLAAQAGDLTESVLKRRAGVKDSGTTFGPSGGMLDLVDSLLLAAPAAAAVWPLLFRI